MGNTYPIGTIINVYPRYGNESTYEIVDFLGKEEKQGKVYDKYVVWDIKSDRSGVKGQPYEKHLPTDLKEGENNLGGNNYYLRFPKSDEKPIAQEFYEIKRKKDSLVPKEIKVEGIKPAYLMTKDEYAKVVTPIVKKYNKFVKANAKYFKKANYDGILLNTFADYFNEIKEKYSKSEYEKSEKEIKEKAIDEWMNDYRKSSGRVLDAVPPTVLQEYQDLVKEFTDYFGDEGVAKFQSDEVGSPKRAINRAQEKGLYEKLMLDGTINYANVTEIFTSVGLKIPSKLEKVSSEIQEKGVSSDTIALTKEVELAFYKNLYDLLRPEMQWYFDDFYNTYERVLSKYEKYQKSEFFNPLNVDNSFGEYLGKPVLITPKPTKWDKNNVEKIYCYEVHFINGIGKTYIDRKLKMILPNWRDVLEENAEKNISELIANLAQHILYHLQGKTAVPEQPKITNFSVYDVKGGKINGTVTLTYSNGFRVMLDFNMIIAGGYNIQVRHYRYLLHALVNGKSLSESQLKKAFAEYVLQEQDEKKSEDEEVKNAESNIESLHEKITMQIEDLSELLEEAKQGDNKGLIQEIEDQIEFLTDLKTHKYKLGGSVEKALLLTEDNYENYEADFISISKSPNYVGVYEFEDETGLSIEYGKYGYGVPQSQQYKDLELIQEASKIFNEKHKGKLFSVASSGDKFNIVRIMDMKQLGNSQEAVESLSKEDFHYFLSIGVRGKYIEKREKEEKETKEKTKIQDAQIASFKEATGYNVNINELERYSRLKGKTSAHGFELIFRTRQTERKKFDSLSDMFAYLKSNDFTKYVNVYDDLNVVVYFQKDYFVIEGKTKYAKLLYVDTHSRPKATDNLTNEQLVELYLNEINRLEEIIKYFTFGITKHENMTKIPIEKEPKDLYEGTHVYERCYFCHESTDTWHIDTNQPVCKDCAEIHEVSELPKPFKHKQISVAPIGSWVQNKKTKTKAMVWEENPKLGLFKIQDEYGTKDNMWRSVSEWKVIPKPKKETSIPDLKENKEALDSLKKEIDDQIESLNDLLIDAKEENNTDLVLQIESQIEFLTDLKS